MAEEIIIKVKADTGEVEPSIEAIKRLGKAAEEDVKSFVKLDDAIKKGVNQGIKDAAVELQRMHAASGKATKESAAGFTSLRAQIKAARDEASSYADQESAAAIAAQKRLADLVERQDDLNKRVQALNPEERFRAFSQVTQGAIGGLQTLTGALQAFGVENEQVQEIAQRLQGVLNLSQGINSILSLGDAMKNLKVALGIAAVAQEGVNAAQTRGVAATKSLTAALLLNPITATIAALGLAVGAYYAFSDSVDEATAEQEEFNKKLAESNKKLDEQIEKMGSLNREFLDTDSVIARVRTNTGVAAITTEELTTAVSDLKKQMDSVTGDNFFTLTTDAINSQEDFEKAREQFVVNEKKRINELIRDLNRLIEARNPKEEKVDRTEVDYLARKNTPLVLNPEVEAINARDTMDTIKDIITEKASDIPPVNVKVQITEEDMQQVQEALNEVANFSSAFFELQNNLSAQQADNRIADLERQKNAGIINEEQYNQQVKKIRTDQAQQEKAQALFAAFINTAAAVTKALPDPVRAALAAALGAVQIAAISARPIPKFKKGTLSVPGINQGDDSVMAMLQPGEAVIPRSTNINYQPAVNAIYNKKIPAKVMNNFVREYVTGKTSTTNVNAKVDSYAIRYAMDGVGMKIKNTKQLASDIADMMPVSSNVRERRLWR